MTRHGRGQEPDVTALRSRTSPEPATGGQGHAAGTARGSSARYEKHKPHSRPPATRYTAGGWICEPGQVRGVSRPSSPIAASWFHPSSTRQVVCTGLVTLELDGWKLLRPQVFDLAAFGQEQSWIRCTEVNIRKIHPERCLPGSPLSEVMPSHAPLSQEARARGCVIASSPSRLHECRAHLGTGNRESLREVRRGSPARDRYAAMTSSADLQVTFRTSPRRPRAGLPPEFILATVRRWPVTGRTRSIPEHSVFPPNQITAVSQQATEKRGLVLRLLVFDCYLPAFSLKATVTGLNHSGESLCPLGRSQSDRESGFFSTSPPVGRCGERAACESRRCVGRTAGCV
ncbi:hypothetical protein AGIG_G12761 [Arapaima gigas]